MMAISWIKLYQYKRSISESYSKWNAQHSSCASCRGTVRHLGCKALGVHGTGEDIHSQAMKIHLLWWPLLLNRAGWGTAALLASLQESWLQPPNRQWQILHRGREKRLRGKGEAARLELGHKIRLQLCYVLIALFNSSFYCSKTRHQIEC